MSRILLLCFALSIVHSSRHSPGQVQKWPQISTLRARRIEQKVRSYTGREPSPLLHLKSRQPLPAANDVTGCTENSNATDIGVLLSLLSSKWTNRKNFRYRRVEHFFICRKVLLSVLFSGWTICSTNYEHSSPSRCRLDAEIA